MVKGVHFEGLRVLGFPGYFAKLYEEEGADELIFIDAVASLYGRNTLLEIIERTAQEVFIPITVGGGLRTIDDIRQVLRSGADKVAINSAALIRPELIREASEKFGSSTIIVSINARKTGEGMYEALGEYGREKTGRNAVAWACEVVSLGAGEVMVTSVDHEGTGKGFDLDLVRQVAKAVSVPVIAGGGAGKSEDLVSVVQQGSADAICIASILHYHYYLKKLPVYLRENEGNMEFLKRGQRFGLIQSSSLPDLKAQLVRNGIDCRVTGRL